MKFLRYLLIPFTICYIGITSFRNWLYKTRIKRSLKFNLPIINIGNLSVGGTGKTPHIELLIKLFIGSNSISTLSRGYGRKKYGFILADLNSTALDIGDEPLQFKRKFKNKIDVAVDVNRVNGVSELCLKLPDLDLILLDDAYQHRAIKPGFNILLTDYSSPYYSDFVLPVGNLRELRKGADRADVIIVSKCPNFDNIDKKSIQNKINPKHHQSLFYSKIIYDDLLPLTKFNKLDNLNEEIILVTGIAKSLLLYSYLSKSFKIIKHFKFPDHYQFKEKDIEEIHKLLTTFGKASPRIVTTEKDAMRLLSSEFNDLLKDKPWFYQTISIEIDKPKEFNEILKEYVQKNSRDY